MSNPGLRRRTWKRFAWLGLILLAIPAVAIGLRARRAKPAPVRVHKVERGTVRDFVTSIAAGRVAARREVTLRAEFAGTVQKLAHRRGDRVKPGDPLIVFDLEDLRDRLRVAESTVLLGRAQVAQAASSAEVVRRSASRARQLGAAGAAPMATVDDLAGQVDVAEKSLEAARAAMRQGQANADLARTALHKGVLRSPFAGVVLSTAIEEGEISAPGAPLVSIADDQDLHVDAELDEADLGRVRVGMPAEVSLDAYPGLRFSGALSEIAPSVTRDLRGNKSVAVDVALRPDERLRIGMSADVDVIVAVRHDVLWVPPNAVQGRGKERVVLLADRGVVRRRLIETGISTWESVEVASGLVAGDRVVVSLSSVDLKDGVPIVVEGEDEPTHPAAPATPPTSADRARSSATVAAGGGALVARGGAGARP